MIADFDFWDPLCTECYTLLQAKRFKQCCEEQFLACNANLRKLKTMNCMLSGSTGVIALLQASLLCPHETLQLHISPLVVRCPADFQRQEFAAKPGRPGVPCSLDYVVKHNNTVQAGSKLLVANIGDSRCMLGRIPKAGALTSVALSVDHVPDVPSEAARIRGQGVRPSLKVARMQFQEGCTVCIPPTTTDQSTL